jgi:hypothetical protein
VDEVTYKEKTKKKGVQDGRTRKQQEMHIDARKEEKL